MGIAIYIFCICICILLCICICEKHLQQIVKEGNFLQDFQSRAEAKPEGLSGFQQERPLASHFASRPILPNKVSKRQHRLLCNSTKLSASSIQQLECAIPHHKKSGFSYYTPWGPPPLPPLKSDKTLYTGIYLPTFREGTNFIIKLLVSCLGALTGPRESPPWYL